MGKTRLAVIFVAVVAASAVAAPAAQAQTATPAETAYQAKIGFASPPAPVYYQRVAFNFWKAWDCLFAAGAFVAGNTYLVLKIKRFGGIAKFAKSLWKARSAEERSKVIFKAIGYVAGTGALVKACTP